MPCEDGGRICSDEATSQGIPKCAGVGEEKILLDKDPFKGLYAI